jgi:hypothetical protein
MCGLAACEFHLTTNQSSDQLDRRRPKPQMTREAPGRKARIRQIQNAGNSAQVFTATIPLRPTALGTIALGENAASESHASISATE